LSEDGTTPGQVADLLAASGFGASEIVVLEALGGSRERVTRHRASGFGAEMVDQLNMMAITMRADPGVRVLAKLPGLPDDAFEHDGQITKSQIRAVTLAALAPHHGEVLWDIGAGSGSVAIEWMLCDPHNRAIAIERDRVRAARILRNAAALGVPDLTLVEGAAPDILHDLPVPDAIFIGGGATRPGVIDAALAALPAGGRLVVNGVTLETQAVLIGRFKQLGGQMTSIQIAHADPVGGFHSLRPAMAVMQWSLTKP
jgi:precorrin-6Y C5,15-methyltransferase (decarboxylating)